MFIRLGCGIEDGLYLFLPTTLLLINMDTVCQRDSNAMIDQQSNAHYGVKMNCNVMIADGILIVLIKQLFFLKVNEMCKRYPSVCIEYARHLSGSCQ